MVALSGGAKLDAALKKMATQVSKAASVEVGFPGGATYPDGTSVALVAALNEFGSKNTPPRPFFRQMIAAKSSQWPETIATLLKANDFDAAKTLGLTGQGIADQLQQSIVDFTSPPLAPSTIAKKGNDKVLVDTGQMLQSVTFVVK